MHQQYMKQINDVMGKKLKQSETSVIYHSKKRQSTLCWYDAENVLKTAVP